MPERTTPEGLKVELRKLQDTDGLFTDPAYYMQEGSIYSTALVGEALGGWPLTSAQGEAVGRRLCDSIERHELPPIILTWAVSAVLGPVSGTARVRECLSRTPPEPSGDPHEDVPLLWTWAVTGHNLKESRSDIARVVRPLLGRLSVDRVTSPYVLWRLDQLKALIGEPVLAGLRPAPPPSRLNDVAELMDLWGHAERCGVHPELCVTTGAPSFDAVMNAERWFETDVTTAAAIAIARLQGHSSAVEEFRTELQRRIHPETGLIRWERPHGRIASTFLALEIAPDLFPGESAHSAAEAARERITLVSSRDTLTRMKGIAILKALGGTAWMDYEPEIRAAASELASGPVTLGSLQSRIELIDALRLVDAGVPRLALKLFPIEDDPSRNAARVALAYADIFANASAIRVAFSDLDVQLLADATTPESGRLDYLIIVNAVKGARLQLTPQQRESIVAGVKRLQGCQLNGAASIYLFRPSIDSTACSLEATWLAMRSGFASVDQEKHHDELP
jgi:hypothetical protein